MHSVQKKIVSYAVVSQEDLKAEEEARQREAKLASEGAILSRPENLKGTTYKVKSPVLDSALYVTINDILVGEGTEHQQYRPFEIFINSKNMEHYQWIVALTRVISAVFRKGGDIAFLVEELQSVFDPSGGYFKKGGKYVPSLVAEIGLTIEEHLKSVGIIKTESHDDHQQSLINEKREQYVKENPGAELNIDGYPASATVCKKCSTKAVIQMGGCAVCLGCSDSKCQ